ncbi:UrcA family protein [Aurantiacibacter hainanensis]|uniref:UrcA family protein n=1 Tax=Aurantiacibacter hainanensis TaxID=3076114 RepID=UPI0030C6CCCB
MSSKTIKTTAAAAFAALFAVQVAVPTVALAQEEVRQQYVEYGDLNLQTPEGIATLDSRIEHAISRVCRVPSATTLSERMQVKKCEREAETGVAGQREFAINQARGSVELAGADGDPNRPSRIRLAFAN